jgi:hypothetical protein
LTGDLYVDGGSITVDPDVAGSVFTWKESDSTTVAGELRGYANRGDIYLYSNGIKKTELSSQNDSFIPALHIGGTTAASGGGLQVTGQGIFTGNVGIGTTSPGAKLSIAAGASDANTEQIRFNRTNDEFRYNSIFSTISSSSSTAKISFGVHDSVTSTSQATVMSLLGNGNVGIGRQRRYRDD